MKIGFFGTPDIAAYYLENLIGSHEIVYAVTAPDKPRGRHSTPSPCPAKEVAVNNNIPVLQPDNILDEKFIHELSKKNPDVFVVTADHSTPAVMKAHSWHPVPVLLNSTICRPDAVTRFDEISCIQGGLGRQPSMNLMPIVLANALRLAKFGA